MATGVNNLLAVSWAMPPMLFPRSIQVSRVLAALAMQGWKITVVCNDARSVRNLDFSLEKLYAHGYETVCVAAEVSTAPDDALMSSWLKPALKEVKRQLSLRNYSALVTFAQPWVDHLIGLKAYPINIPWIAHFSDPWVDSPYYANFDENQLNRWRKMEGKVIRFADRVLFTNTQAADLVMRKYPLQWRAKTSVIPHAFDADLAQKAQSLPRHNGRLRMTYTGDLYANRSAEGFLKALSFLSQTRPLAQEIEVEFAGRIAAQERQLVEVLKLKSIVKFHDQVPYMESLQKVMESDVLLLIDAVTSAPSPFLPSKLVDYLTFRKPILGLTNAGGASAELLRRLGFPIVPAADIPAIASALNSLLDAWRTDSLVLSPDYEKVASYYTTQNVGMQFNQVLQEAISHHQQKPWWRVWS